MSQQSSKAPAFVTSLTPEPDIKDTLPHDYQPPGVDEEEEEDFPQSLEEALMS
tara:strand:+ start:534 stop:692 length:159 start_codon:yes stop_codon:yes gene_type:complete